MARYQKAPDPLPAVKSIQTGRSFGTSGTTGQTSEDSGPFMDVTIAPVDISKSIIDIMSVGINSDSFATTNQRPAFARFLSSTAIRVSNAAGSGNGMNFRWRVVEYN